MNRLYWIIGPGLLSILCIMLKWCFNYRQMESLKDHSNFVNMQNTQNNEEEIVNVNLFQSGLWSNRYFQDENWHGPYHLSISFDPQTMKVTGTGSDDVGTFTIDGIYSLKTNRIGLTKSYTFGTGDKKRNLGHQVIIQLTWNINHHQFEGNWFIILPINQGPDQFELKFDTTPGNNV